MKREKGPLIPQQKPTVSSSGVRLGRTLPYLSCPCGSPDDLLDGDRLGGGPLGLGDRPGDLLPSVEGPGCCWHLLGFSPLKLLIIRGKFLGANFPRPNLFTAETEVQESSLFSN